MSACLCLVRACLCRVELYVYPGPGSFSPSLAGSLCRSLPQLATVSSIRLAACNARSRRTQTDCGAHARGGAADSPTCATRRWCCWLPAPRSSTSTPLSAHLQPGMLSESYECLRWSPLRVLWVCVSCQGGVCAARGALGARPPSAQAWCSEGSHYPLQGGGRAIYAPWRADVAARGAGTTAAACSVATPRALPPSTWASP